MISFIKEWFKELKLYIRKSDYEYDWEYPNTPDLFELSMNIDKYYPIVLLSQRDDFYAGRFTTLRVRTSLFLNNKIYTILLILPFYKDKDFVWNCETEEFDRVRIKI